MLITAHRPQTFVVSSPQCPPTCRHHSSDQEGCSFQVKWKINPHMKLGAVQEELAFRQHRHFCNTLRARGAQVLEIPFIHGAYDSVFTKDSAVLRTGMQLPQAFLSHPRHEIRQQEIRLRARALESMGFEVAGHADRNFEGGDLVMFPGGGRGYLGHGFRTEKEAGADLENFLDAEVFPLELKDPYFYHLDTALAFTEVQNFIGEMPGVVAFAYPEAFTKSSWEALNSDPYIQQVVSVSREEALKFGLNWVEVNDCIILGSQVPGIASALESLGKDTVVAELDQFQLAGGSAACLTTRMHPATAEYVSLPHVNVMPKFDRTGTEARGVH